MSFKIKDILHNKAKALLKIETEPGLGCTDPAAIGLCSAAAASLLKDRTIESIKVIVSPNIYKNAMGVIIPASGGERGIPMAAAMGSAAGDPANRLQVFSTVDSGGLEKAKTLLKEGCVSAEIREGHAGVYVRTVVLAGGQTAEAVIEGEHNHIKSLSLDGEPQKGHPLLACVPEKETNVEDLEKWLISLSLGDIVALLDDLDSDDIFYVQQGIDLNRALVEYGLTYGPGLGAGKSQQSLVRRGLIKTDMAFRGGMAAAAGIDSRMGGVDLPAMTLAGSGNQGIAAGMPIVAVAGFATLDDDFVLIRAVILSYLITCYIKTRVGRLSALCGSAVASGAGVAAGVGYLLGGSVEKIGGAIMNHIENFSTIICDGAKTGCALKVGEAASSAVKSALMALHGTVVRPADGIIDKGPEVTMCNVGRLTREGLSRMDATILDIMLRKGI